MDIANAVGIAVNGRVLYGGILFMDHVYAYCRGRGQEQ